MDTVHFLTTLVENHQLWAYGIILVGIILEGEFFIIATGILSHLGALSFWWMLPFVILASLCKTLLGYQFGAWIRKFFKNVKFFKFIEKKINTIVPRFKQRPFWSIFASKFIWGTNNIVILYSGYERVNYRKYLRAETISTLIWAPIVLCLGYLFSYTALAISQEIYRFTLIILVLFILFIIFDKVISLLYEMFEEFYNNESK